MKTNAAVLNVVGEGPRVQEFELRPLASDEAAVEMLYAAINPADLNIIEGKYGRSPELPAILGQEGVGRVVEVGSDSGEAKVGDLVLSLERGSWCQRRHVRKTSLIKLPADIDLHQAAMLTANPPTAYRMLVDFLPMIPGDWLVQNAANSGVGCCVIQIARELGLRSVNVVRRPEVIDTLQRYGGDQVVTEETNLREEIEELCGGRRPKLALNAVGGASALNLANSLANDSVMVTYGAMGRQPLKIPNGLLIFRNLTFRGFWVSRWVENASRAAIQEMFDRLIAWCMIGRLRQPIDRVFSLDSLDEALEAAAQDRRRGKVLLKL